MLLYRLKRYIKININQCKIKDSLQIIKRYTLINNNIFMLLYCTSGNSVDEDMFVVRYLGNYHYIQNCSSVNRIYWKYGYGKIINRESPDYIDNISRYALVVEIMLKYNNLHILVEKSFGLINNWKNVQYVNIKDRNIYAKVIKIENNKPYRVIYQFIRDVLIICDINKMIIYVYCDNWDREIKTIDSTINCFYDNFDHECTSELPYIINMGKPLRLNDIIKYQSMVQNQIIKNWLILSEKRLLRKLVVQLASQIKQKT